MAHFQTEDVAILPKTRAAKQSDEPAVDSNFRRPTPRMQSVSISIPIGMCNDPYCTTCPAYFKASQQTNPKASTDSKVKNSSGDANGFGRKLFSFCTSCVPGVMNPHAKVVQRWNQILAIFCLVAIFVDPLFLFLIYVKKDYKCIAINWTMGTTLVLLRSINDFVYFLNILLQFRLAYVSPESRVDLVVCPRKIALNCLKGYFLLDLFVVLPLPQIIMLFVLPHSLGSTGANYAKNLLRLVILIQYLPRLFRFLPPVVGLSPTGFIFESARANVVINLLIFMLSGHVVGSCWYLFGLQQISTLAGNQTPSNFVWEVVFTMAIIGLGLLLFAFLIGNVQNFLEGLGRRRLDMQLQRRDVKKWMSHRRLPKNLRRRVRKAERYNWAATRGVSEEMVLGKLPEDLQTDIRRHLFKFVKKVQILAQMDEPLLEAICKRLKRKTYIKGSRILDQGYVVEKMVFVKRGKLESTGKDGTVLSLSEGDVCGEELLSLVSKDGEKAKPPGERLLSNKTVTCLTNVEAFSLDATDIEEVAILFPSFLRRPNLQRALSI